MDTRNYSRVRFLLPLVGAVLLGMLAACGSQNVSHPALDGHWLLVKKAGEEVPAAERLALRIYGHQVEVRDAASGVHVLGGVRTLKWEGDELVVAPCDTEAESRAHVLSTSKQSLEIDQIFGWPRAAFQVLPDDHWAALVARGEATKRNQSVSNVSLLSDGLSWESKVVAHVKSQLQGVWEKLPTSAPFPGMGMLVEIGNDQIRGQAYAPLVHKDLLGKEEPCRFDLISAERANVFCPSNSKTYSMVIKFDSPTEMNVDFGDFHLKLLRSRPERFGILARQHGIQFSRIEPGSGHNGAGVVAGGDAAGNTGETADSPNP